MKSLVLTLVFSSFSVTGLSFASAFVDICESADKSKSQAEVFKQVFQTYQTDSCREAEAAITESKRIKLIGNVIKDLSPFQDFTAIEKLDLRTTALQDLTALSSLPRLRSLHLADTGPLDFTPLADLQSLRIVRLRYTDTTHLANNLKVLASLTSLRVLSLTGMRLSDESTDAIATMTSLEDLIITMEPTIRSITFVSPLKRLKRFHLGGTEVRDISPLVHAKELRELMIVSTPIRNLSVLNEIGSSLKWLAVHHTLVRDFSPLSHCPNITMLWLSAAHLSEIPDLSSLKKLTQLTLDDNDISSLEPLEQLNRLEAISLENNQIVDLTALKDHDRLYRLNLKGNPLGSTIPKTAKNCPQDGKSELIAEFCRSERPPGG